MTPVVRRNPRRTAAGIVVLVLLLVLLGELAWNFGVAPRLAIRNISLESDLGISDAQLLEMLDLQGQTWASLDEADLERRIESYPVVRKARVIKVFPDSLRLFIYRRSPLTVALVGDGPKMIPAVFDDDGYAVQVGDLAGAENLPILSGVEFGVPNLGVRLPDSFQSLLADLSRLKNDEPKLFALISEIEILPQGRSGYDLRLYMNHIPIPVLVGADLSGDTLRRAILVIDVLASGAAGKVEEADIRGGNVVYRRAEEG